MSEAERKKAEEEKEKLERVATNFAGPLAEMKQEYIAYARKLCRNQNAKEFARAHSFSEGVVFVLLHQMHGQPHHDGYPEEAYTFCKRFCSPKIDASTVELLGVPEEEVRDAFLRVAYRKLLNLRIPLA